MSASHQPEVVEHITTSGRVAESSMIRYFGRCACGWRGENKEHLILAQLDCQMHEAHPWLGNGNEFSKER